MSIALAKKYTPVLDELYYATSKTAILDTPDSQVRWKNANECEILKVTSSGLGTYSRSSGYVTGSVSTAWEAQQITQDRGIEFSVDAMDNEETFDQTALATLSHIVKDASEETDAYRFAKYASATNVSVVSADIGTSTNVVDLIDTAMSALDDDSVPATGRILFISAKIYGQMKKNITRTVMNGENGIQRNVDTYDGAIVVKVPSKLFNTAVTLRSGASNNFGFVPTAGGYKINFMLVHKDAVIQPIKRNSLKTFGPEVNQSTDGTLIQFRRYHDAFVYDNKVAGIYVHKAQTPNT